MDQEGQFKKTEPIWLSKINQRLKDEWITALELDENDKPILSVVGLAEGVDPDDATMLTSGEDESIYVVTKNGIWKYMIDERTPVMLMDGNGTSLQLPSYRNLSCLHI